MLSWLDKSPQCASHTALAARAPFHTALQARLCAATNTCMPHRSALRCCRSSLQEHSGDMQSALVTLKGIVNRHLGVVLDCRPLVLEVADAAAEQAEACIG